MPITDLAAFGLVPCEVQAFGSLLRAADVAENGSFELTALQSLVARRGLLGEHPQRSFVLAGAATGKSTMAALLLLHACHRGENAVLLQPRRVDRRNTRAALATVLPGKEAHAAVLSVQQFLRRIRRERSFLQSLDLLILDDADWLLRPRAARKIEVLLRPIKERSPSLRLVAFGAEHAGQHAAASLAEPLQAEVIYGPPADPILMGVVNQARIELWTKPSIETGRHIEPLLSSGGTGLPGQPRRCDPPTRSGLIETLLHLAKSGEQTLVLVPQRSRMLRLLHRLIDADRPQPTTPAQRALAGLSATAAGHAHFLLSQALLHGIAFDGPELTKEQRRIVSQARANGEVRLCLCHRLPPQLRSNVRVHNLVVVPPAPAQTAEMRHPGDADAHWQRAAFLSTVRRQLGPLGRLLIVAENPRDAATRLRQLSSPPSASHVPAPRVPVRTRGGLASFLRFLPVPPADELAGLEALTLAALSDPRLPLPLLLSEQAGSDYATELLLRAEEQGLRERALFRWLRAQLPKLGHEDLRSLKAVVVLDDWLSGMSTAELERRYHIWAGQLSHCARRIAYRLRRLPHPYKSLALSTPGSSPLPSLIERLQNDGPESVAEHRAAGLSRHIGILLGAMNAQVESQPSHRHRRLHR